MTTRLISTITCILLLLSFLSSSAGAQGDFASTNPESDRVFSSISPAEGNLNSYGSYQTQLFTGAADQFVNNFISQKEGSFLTRLELSASNIDWKATHEGGKEAATAGAVSFGLHGLVESASLNLGGIWDKSEVSENPLYTEGKMPEKGYTYVDAETAKEVEKSNYPGQWQSPNKFGLGGPGEARLISANEIERLRLDYGHEGYEYPHWNQEIYKISDSGKVVIDAYGKIMPYSKGVIDHTPLDPQLPERWWNR